MLKGVQKLMSDFQFCLYLSQLSSHRFNSNITGFHFHFHGIHYLVMKANARVAGNSVCQDLFCCNWGRLDHYKAVMKLFFGGKRAQNNFKCSYNSYWQASFGILWSGFDQPYARKLKKTLMQWQSSLSPHSNFPLPWHGVMMWVIRIVVRSPLRNTTETHYNFEAAKLLV